MATRQRQSDSASAFRFDYRKAAQATACLLRREKNRLMSCYRLLTILYVADREAVRTAGRPILGGRYVATDRGPSHSAMLDLLNGADVQSPDWSKMFRRDRYDVEMVSDPGAGELSKHEIEIINRIAIEHEGDDDHDLSRRTCSFDEYLDHRPTEGSPRPIPFDEVVKAVGREGDLDSIRRDAMEKAVFDKLFGT